MLLKTSTLILCLLALAAWADPLPHGLAATYFSDANWSSSPVRARVESRPSTETIADAWSGAVPDVFSATWTGSFVTLRAGEYTVATTSDDGSWVFVDGQLVVDNGGHHEPRTVRGAIRLARGVHSMYVRYLQDGGDYAFELDAPAWALWARHVGFPRAVASVLLRAALIGFLWVWVTLVAISGAHAAAPWLRQALVHLWADPIRRTLTVIVIASIAIDAIGITWGLPSTWVGDELTPKSVLIAFERHFTGGWWDRYPPLHFYVLTFAYAPWLLLTRLGWAHLPDRTAVMLLSVIGRLVSVAAGAGTVIAVYACGARAFTRRAGLFGAAAIALVPVFAFYAKTANPEVPYVFWFAVALVFFLRAIDTGAPADIAVCFCAAVLSICTKDQAFALFVPMPLVLMWRCRRVADRRLWIGAASAALLFVVVQNIPLNAGGFVSHVRDITGPGRNYRMFAPTPSGESSLLRLTIGLDARAWGWPLFVASLAGFGLAVRGPRRARARAGYLALVAASYYGAFVAVIGYDYDRYLLPVCVVQALFAGVAIDRLVGGSGAAAWRRGAAAALFVYSLLYVATLDALMLRDSRYDAERWLLASAGHDRLVGHAFPIVVLPRMDELSHIDLNSVDDLRRWNPEFFVLNEDYARMLLPHRPEAALIAGLRDGSLGYHLAYRYRARPPWPWLPGAHADLVGTRDEAPVASFLRDVNPTIAIYERGTAQ